MSIADHSHTRRGFTVIELVTVGALLGSLALASVSAWQGRLERERAVSSARGIALQLFRARMSAIYGKTSHLVVLDPVHGRVETFADSGARAGVLDPEDERVRSEFLAPGIALALPARPEGLTSPLDRSPVERAWSFPGRGSDVHGLLITPEGRIHTAEATPRTVDSGLIVLSDAGDRAAAVGIRGRTGTIRSFELSGGRWIPL